MLILPLLGSCFILRFFIFYVVNCNREPDVGLMSMLCAPVRDEQIEALKTKTQVVDIFKGK